MLLGGLAQRGVMHIYIYIYECMCAYLPGSRHQYTQINSYIYYIYIHIYIYTYTYIYINECGCVFTRLSSYFVGAIGWAGAARRLPPPRDARSRGHGCYIYIYTYTYIYIYIYIYIYDMWVCIYQVVWLYLDAEVLVLPPVFLS